MFARARSVSRSVLSDALTQILILCGTLFAIANGLIPTLAVLIYSNLADEFLQPNATLDCTADQTIQLQVPLGSSANYILLLDLTSKEVLKAMVGGIALGFQVINQSVVFLGNGQELLMAEKLLKSADKSQKLLDGNNPGTFLKETKPAITKPVRYKNDALLIEIEDIEVSPHQGDITGSAFNHKKSVEDEAKTGQQIAQLRGDWGRVWWSDRLVNHLARDGRGQKVDQEYRSRIEGQVLRSRIQDLVPRSRIPGRAPRSRIQGQVLRSRIQGQVLRSRMQSKVPRSRIQGQVPRSRMQGQVPRSRMQGQQVDREPNASVETYAARKVDVSSVVRVGHSMRMNILLQSVVWRDIMTDDSAKISVTKLVSSSHIKSALIPHSSAHDFIKPISILKGKVADKVTTALNASTDHTLATNTLNSSLHVTQPNVTYAGDATESNVTSHNVTHLNITDTSNATQANVTNHNVTHLNITDTSNATQANVTNHNVKQPNITDAGNATKANVISHNVKQPNITDAGNATQANVTSHNVKQPNITDAGNATQANVTSRNVTQLTSRMRVTQLKPMLQVTVSRNRTSPMRSNSTSSIRVNRTDLIAIIKIGASGNYTINTLPHLFYKKELGEMTLVLRSRSCKDGASRMRDDVNGLLLQDGLNLKNSKNVDGLSGGLGGEIAFVIQSVTSCGSGFIVSLIQDWKLTLIMMAAAPALTIIGGVVVKVQSYAKKQKEAFLQQVLPLTGQGLTNITNTVTGLATQFIETDGLGHKHTNKLDRLRNLVISFGSGLGTMVLFTFLGLGFSYSTTLLSSGQISPASLLTVFMAVIGGGMHMAGAMDQIQDISSMMQSLTKLTGQTPKIGEGKCEASPHAEANIKEEETQISNEFKSLCGDKPVIGSIDDLRLLKTTKEYSSLVTPVASEKVINIEKHMTDPDLVSSKGPFFTSMIVLLGSMVAFGGTLEKYISTLLTENYDKRLKEMILAKTLEGDNASARAFYEMESSIKAVTEKSLAKSLGPQVQSCVSMALTFYVALSAGWKMTLVALTGYPIIHIARSVQQNQSKKIMEPAVKSQIDGDTTWSSITSLLPADLESTASRRYNQALKGILGSSLAFAVANSMVFVVYALSLEYGSSLVQSGEMTPIEVLSVLMTILFGSNANNGSLGPSHAQASSTNTDQQREMSVSLGVNEISRAARLP
ncbi:predicted protein [Nematostella vectensis]|uniref:ABC transmembrane type-1 domain-containing protein n=1 Tax=Nematostella vectensis TaxID=45351 RepID=A7SG94_NEMVE|nr:predicted protein [Nematostella vectensis]|eukprot:XP_001629358.1 predicted protein [Nematostella vectensis]